MAKQARYKKLIANRSVGGTSRLYLGPDGSAPEHILYVQGNYTEKYRKFPLKDLQSISTRTDRTRMVAMVILGLLLLILGVIIFSSTLEYDGPEFALWVSLWPGVPAAMFLGYAVWVGTGGGFCKTFLCTAVQMTKIEGLDNHRKVKKLLRKIRPLLEAAQGGWTPERYNEAFRNAAPPPQSARVQNYFQGSNLNPPSPPTA